MGGKQVYKVAVITGVIGLILLLSTILSKSSDPDMFFRIAAVLGIILIFVSVALFGISWLVYIKDSIKKKDYIGATIIIIIGLLIIIKALIRIGAKP